MAQFVAYDKKVEVNGETVLAIVDGMGTFKDHAFKILADCGIKDPKPGRWYLQQNWLDAFKTISEKVGPSTLFGIGKKIPENAQFPPEIDNIEKALSSIDVAYHMNHRYGEIGHYNYEKTGPTTVKMTCPNPYPCEFDRGIIEAMARKFKPAEKALVVYHDDKAPCRKKGAESCTYYAQW